MTLLSPNRRNFLKHLTCAANGLLMAQAASALGIAPVAAAKPRRIVFFLQNQGLHPVMCRPSSVRIDDGFSTLPGMTYQYREQDSAVRIDRLLDVPLVGSELPEHFAPLAQYAKRMTVVQGLNGMHARPFHSAGYGALAAMTSGSKRIPGAATIDCVLGQALPAPFPMLGFGWGYLPGMRQSPIGYCSSAWDRNKPAPLYCNPVMAQADLFGAGTDGEARQRFDSDTRTLEVTQHDVRRMQKQLPSSELETFQPLVEGMEAMRRRRQQLAAMADVLSKHAPALTEKYTDPKTDLDWKEAGLEVACAALIAGLTNVVTITSGMCDPGSHGPYPSLGIERWGHSLGHTGPENPDWIKLHSYNSRLISTLIQKLEAAPEGRGTMMDNTLIVYTSCHGERQHSRGDGWPYVLIGDLGGTLATGRYLYFPKVPHAGGPWRTTNALYNTLLHAVGAPRDKFNLEGPLKDKDRVGPIEELLA